MANVKVKRTNNQADKQSFSNGKQTEQKLYASDLLMWGYKDTEFLLLYAPELYKTEIGSLFFSPNLHCKRSVKFYISLCFRDC